MTITSNDKCQISLVYTDDCGRCKATVIQLVPSDIRTYNGVIGWLIDVISFDICTGKYNRRPRQYKLNIAGPTLVAARTVRCMLEIVMAARYDITLRDTRCISARGW